MYRSSPPVPVGLFALVSVTAALTLALAYAPLATAGAAAAQSAASSADWPQWRGPDRTAKSRETALLRTWPADGPSLVWKAEGLGRGYTTPSIAGGKIYGMGARADGEAAWVLDAASGKELWSTPIAQTVRADRRGEGPRCTPTVAGDSLFVLGDTGELACLEAATGKVRWQKSLVRDFGGRVPHWGYSESPLVDGDRVICTPGGPAATLVALDRRSGEVVWKSQVPGGDAAAYSSIIAADLAGGRQYIQFLAGGVVGVAASDGKFLWRYDRPANRTANCSTPIYRDGHVFAASAYGVGGGLVKIPPGPGEAAEVYFTRQMQNHHGGMVLVGDYLYGFDNASLTCLDFRTGEVKWVDRSVGKGSLAYADGHLYARSEGGPVALVEATHEAYREKARFPQPSRSAMPAWPHPVIAGGRLYLRDQDILLCYAVKE